LGEIALASGFADADGMGEGADASFFFWGHVWAG
jgi:hypothetical protein